MSEELKEEFRQKSAEELRGMAEEFREYGWEGHVETVEAVLREDKGKPTHPEEDQDVIGESEADLQEKLEWFEEKGWDSNAERVREELSRQENMDSSEELDDFVEDLEAEEELSEDDTVEMQVAKFYSSGEKYGDPDDMTEAERQALEEEGVSLS